MSVRVEKIAIKILLYSLIFLTVSFFSLLYVASSGVPFIEGDVRVIEGEAYGFTIGMSKMDAYQSIKRNYQKDDFYIRVLWLKGSEVNKKLEIFQNTKWKEYFNRTYSEYKAPINSLNNLTLPLELGSRWDIEMPADWVNTIYLSFNSGKLNEIQKSRWLFERP